MEWEIIPLIAVLLYCLKTLLDAVARGGSVMIMQDVMITYNRRTKIYRFYDGNNEQVIKGDMAYHRVCGLLAKAIEKEERNNGDLR